jgi:hypothetical protein
MFINLEEIGYDPKYYPRANGKEDWFTVNKYRDALLSDPAKEFPPVVVVRSVGHREKYLLIDGKHRCEAYSQADRQQIPTIVERLPQSRWFARSVELNITHGRTLDVGDKAWIAVRLAEDGYSPEQAAGILQMRVETMEKIKAGSIVKLRAKAAKSIPFGRGNREVGESRFGFLKSPFKGFVGTATAESALAVQDPVAASDVLHILDSAIAVLECGVDTTEEEVVARISRLKELLADS